MLHSQKRQERHLLGADRLREAVIFLLFIIVNLLLMAALFAFGMYQFMQVEEKRKRGRLLSDAAVDITELQDLLGANKHEEAVNRLMVAADVDRFTAESAVAQLKERRTQ